MEEENNYEGTENIYEGTGDPEAPKRPQLGDKIFGAHNNPSAETDYRENFDLDTQHRFLEDSFDEEEYLHRKKLEETVFTAFQSSRWYPLSYKKKIPKDLIPHLFQDVLEKLDGTEFGFSEKFVVICDFVSIPYTKAYELIPAKYKEIIVNGLEIKFGILSRKKIKRLF
jgi:hypothetical protein